MPSFFKPGRLFKHPVGTILGPWGHPGAAFKQLKGHDMGIDVGFSSIWERARGAIFGAFWSQNILGGGLVFESLFVLLLESKSGAMGL